MTTKEFKVQLALGSLSYEDKIKLAYNPNRVVENPNTPKEVLRRLSTDKNWFVIRCKVTFNPNTPKDVLKKLSKDEHEYVRYWATRAIKLEGKW